MALKPRPNMLGCVVSMALSVVGLVPKKLGASILTASLGSWRWTVWTARVKRLVFLLLRLLWLMSATMMRPSFSPVMVRVMWFGLNMLSVWGPLATMP